jgi:hypothetical protein
MMMSTGLVITITTSFYNLALIDDKINLFRSIPIASQTHKKMSSLGIYIFFFYQIKKENNKNGRFIFWGGYFCLRAFYFLNAPEHSNKRASISNGETLCKSNFGLATLQVLRQKTTEKYT